MKDEYKTFDIIEESSSRYILYNIKKCAKYAKEIQLLKEGKGNHQTLGKILGFSCPLDIINLLEKELGHRIRVIYSLEIWTPKTKKLLFDNEFVSSLCSEKDYNKINLKQLLEEKAEIQKVADQLFPNHKTIVRLTIQSNDHKGLWK